MLSHAPLPAIAGRHLTARASTGVPRPRADRRNLVARLRPSSPTLLERVYLVVTFSVLLAVPFLIGDQSQDLSDPLNPVRYLENQSTGGNVDKQLFLLALYAGAAVLFLLYNRVGSLRFLGAPLLALMLWCIVSALWSVDTAVTLRRCAAIGGVVILGLYAGLRFPIEDLLRVMAQVTAIILIASLVVAMLRPVDGLDADGRLRGVFDHKNDLGSFAGLGLFMVAARLALSRSGRRSSAIFEWFLAFLCLGSLAWGQAASPIPVLIVALLALFAARFLRDSDRSMLAMLPLLICVAILLVMVAALNIGELAPLLDRSPSLSGRTLIWQFALRMITVHPLIGYGYGAFWTGGNSPGSLFWRTAHIAAPHAHDGYLQLLLDAGAIGLALLFMAIAATLYRLSWLLRREKNAAIPWALAYLAFIAIVNVTENKLWTGNSLEVTLLVYVVVRANSLIAARASAVAPAPIPALRHTGTRRSAAETAPTHRSGAAT